MAPYSAVASSSWLDFSPLSPFACQIKSTRKKCTGTRHHCHRCSIPKCLLPGNNVCSGMPEVGSTTWCRVRRKLISQQHYPLSPLRPPVSFSGIQIYLGTSTRREKRNDAHKFHSARRSEVSSVPVPYPEWHRTTNVHS